MYLSWVIDTEWEQLLLSLGTKYGNTIYKLRKASISQLSQCLFNIGPAASQTRAKIIDDLMFAQIVGQR